MDWTFWVMVISNLMLLATKLVHRKTMQMRHNLMRDFLMASAKQSTRMAEHWQSVAKDETKTSSERMTAVQLATVLLGSSIAYQDAAHDVHSFLVEGKRCGERGAINLKGQDNGTPTEAVR